MVKLVPIPHQIWNDHDEYGLKFGLERNYLEPDYKYNERLRDVFINKGSSTYQGLINSISREFGLKTYNVEENRIFTLSFSPTKPPQVYIINEYNKKEIINEDEYSIDKILLDSGEEDLGRLFRYTGNTIKNKTTFFVEYEHFYFQETRKRCDKFTLILPEEPKYNQIRIKSLNDHDFRDELIKEDEEIKANIEDREVKDKPDWMPIIKNGKVIYRTTLDRWIYKINKMSPIMWGNFIWRRSRYDSLSETYPGAEYLPMKWDGDR